MNHKETLKEKVADKSASLAVIGLGYVGLPFAVEKAKVGYKVIGIDQNPARVAKINDGLNYISDVKDEDLVGVVNSGNLKATTDSAILQDTDIIVICVPTPLDKGLTPDLQFVKAVTREIARHLHNGQLISLESTTYPGTTEEIMLPILEESGLKPEEDFFLCHSPERVDPGNKRYTTCNTNKVVGGIGPNSLEVGLAFYSQTIEHLVPVSSAKAAELVKVYENTFRAVNIALVNELATLCDKMDLSVWEVLDAAFTKPFGIMPFYPGPGVGGHCIPIDPHYLEWKAREFNFSTRFIGLAGEVNRRMPEFVKDKTCHILNEIGLSISKAKILIMGVAYKKDLSDCRESPALYIIEQFIKAGNEPVYHDPFVDEFEICGRKFTSQSLTEELVKNADLVLIVTDHSDIDYGFLVKHASKIFDTRNVTKNIPGKENKVILL